MGTIKSNRKSTKNNKRFRKTRSKRQRGGNERMETQINTVGLNNAFLSAIEVAPADESDYEDVKYLIEKGANVNIRAREEWNYRKTPLMLITENAEDPYDENEEIDLDNFPTYKIVKLLLERGANITAKDNEGDTAIDLTPSIEIQKLLIYTLLSQNNYYYTNTHQMIWDLNLDSKLVKEIKDKITIEKERERIKKERERDRGNLAVIQAATKRGNTEASWEEKDVMGLLTEGQGPYAKNIKSFLGGKRKTKKSKKSKRKTRKTRRK